MAIWDNMDPLPENEDELFADFDSAAEEAKKKAEEEAQEERKKAFGTFGIKPQASANPYYTNVGTNASKAPAFGYMTEPSTSKDSLPENEGNSFIEGHDAEQDNNMSLQSDLFSELDLSSKDDQSQRLGRLMESGAGQPMAYGNFGATKPVKDRENDYLVVRFKKYTEMFAECETLATMIKPEDSFPQTDGNTGKKKTFFGYFWPYLLTAILSGVFIYFVGFFIVVLSKMRSIAEQGADVVIGDYLLTFAIAVIVGVAIMLIGIKCAKAKQKTFNDKVDYNNQMDEEFHKRAVDNQKMINRYQMNMQKMNEYEQLLPVQYRNIDSITAILELLESGKASSLDEACAMIA